MYSKLAVGVCTTQWEERRGGQKLEILQRWNQLHLLTNEKKRVKVREVSDNPNTVNIRDWVNYGASYINIEVRRKSEHF